MGKTALFIGAFDTKGAEYRYVYDLVVRRGHTVLTMNTGVMGEAQDISVNISAESVAAAAGERLENLRAAGDRGRAMSVMSVGAQRLTRDLYEQHKFDAVFGMGGTGGTSVVSAAMRSLPLGVPKVIVSTAASGDTRSIVGTKDIVLIPSVVDVAGINRISSLIYNQAASALCGLLEHAGSTMGATHGDEAVLDITTTEWADELCGGVFPARPNRLEAPGRRGVPHLIVPGCVDMVNFGPKETVPEKFRDRHLYVWNPQVTLMRTTAEENRQLGLIFAEKANLAKGPLRFLLPTKGVSILDSEGNEFWSPEADREMFSAIKENVMANVPVEEVGLNINDPAFAELAVKRLVEMVKGVSSGHDKG